MPFYPTNNPKNQNFSKMKKTHGDIITLHMRTKTHGHMLYCSWGMGHDECNCCFSFWIYFCAFTPITAKKTFFLNEEISYRYHHFTHVYQKLWSDDVRFLRYGAWQMERQTDRWTGRHRKSEIYRWVPCLKIRTYFLHKKKLRK